MKNKIKEIRQACIKANPEILSEKCCGHCLGTGNAEAFGEEGECAECDLGIITDKSSKILGRPIRLADVLIPLARKLGAHRPTINYTIDKIIFNGGAPWNPSWNLLKDSLSDQSEETVNFIYELLKNEKETLQTM